MTTCREEACNAAYQLVSEKRNRTGYRFVKRALDIVISLTALILLFVPMMIIALIIRLESRGQALFKQRRIGLLGKEFTIYKFRSMYLSAPRDTATNDLEDAKIHITRVGAFLRKTSLDELPQLINILRGDMSLIGPRPLIVSEDIIHVLRKEAGVYSIRPGITGWAQINGRDCVDADTKVALDIEYLRNFSFAMDFRILLRTMSVVITGDGFSEGQHSDPTDANNSCDKNDFAA